MYREAKFFGAFAVVVAVLSVAAAFAMGVAFLYSIFTYGWPS